MSRAQQIAAYLRGLGNDKDADYVVYLAESLENDQEHIVQLTQERDELAARVERLREAGDALYNDENLSAMKWDLTEAETPAQSLAAVCAGAVSAARKYVVTNISSDDTADMYDQHLMNYVQRTRDGKV